MKNVMPVLEERYLRKDAEGKVIETPEDMFMRVAKFLAPDDPQPYFELMNNLLFMPNSST